MLGSKAANHASISDLPSAEHAVFLAGGEVDRAE
jgi:hypothetical protein